MFGEWGWLSEMIDSSFSFALSVSTVRSGLRLSPSAGRSGSGGMFWGRKWQRGSVIGDEKINHSIY